jgi:hypothetical protein
MLQRVAESPIDDCIIDRRNHRKLDPLLIPIDVRLQKGASRSSLPRASWPLPVLVVDAAVQRLYWTLRAAGRQKDGTLSISLRALPLVLVN